MNLFDRSPRMGLADSALLAVPYGNGKFLASILHGMAMLRGLKLYGHVKPVFTTSFLEKTLAE